MSVAHSRQSPTVTEHALLVAYGRFAAQIGLTDALNQVPFKMKTVDHSPGDKLSELLVHILAGGMHLCELGRSAHPLVQDPTVAHAWGQHSFASASGVSDLLRAATPQTVEGLKAQIRQLSEPYRRRILRDLSSSWLVVDLDLTALVVSDQAATYEGAEFGYMGEVDGPGKGYQFARAQVAGPQDALLLGGFLHPGRTVSQHCLGELVALVEAELGRPRRRVEAVERRLVQAEREMAAIEGALAQRAQGSAWLRRRQKYLQRQRERKQEEIEQLRLRREEMAADNATNPNPRRIILRLDGGFGDAGLLAWLYEQGYDFVARAHNWRVAEGMRAEEGLSWQKVSKNGFIAESKRTNLGCCPYPLRLFACRQWRGEDKPERWSALVVNQELAPNEWPVRRIGVFYNGRQVAEAAIKESKGIFASRHLPTRREAGIAVYQELVLLAQNLVRWFRRQFLGQTVLAAAGIKEMVRIGANSRALIVAQDNAIVLQFAADSPWRGITLPLNTQIGYQMWFPFLEDRQFAHSGP
jgi:hypothetical protein